MSKRSNHSQKLFYNKKYGHSLIYRQFNRALKQANGFFSFCCRPVRIHYDDKRSFSEPFSSIHLFHIFLESCWFFRNSNILHKNLHKVGLFDTVIETSMYVYIVTLCCHANLHSVLNRTTPHLYNRLYTPDHQLYFVFICSQNGFVSLFHVPFPVYTYCFVIF